MSGSNTAPVQQRFPARFVALAETASFAQRFCDEHGVARAQAQRLRLVLEELFTNTIRHGHRDESDAPVDIQLAFADSRVAVRYEDSAPPFNPLVASGSRDEEGTPVAQRSVGGLGVRLLTQLAEQAAYAYVDGRNRIDLVVRASRPER